MAKNKEKKENLRMTEVPSTEILEKGAEVSEVQWNKTEEIEGDEIISEKAFNSNDAPRRPRGICNLWII